MGDGALVWCLKGVKGSRDPFSGTPTAHGGSGGAAPARLLSFCCCTALLLGAGKRKPACDFLFFPQFCFCQTYMLPLVKVLTDTQERESKKRV